MEEVLLFKEEMRGVAVESVRLVVEERRVEMC